MGLRSVVGRALDVVDRGNRVRRLRDRFVESRRHRWLRRVSNLIHAGANTGQEAALYERYGLGVLWIEPDASVFESLVAHIRPYPKQAARKALLADVAGRRCTFHVANNSGASSSMMNLAEHREIWPGIEFTRSVELVTETLDNVLAEDHRAYDALVVNTQGAELLVMKGAVSRLGRLRFILARVADFNSYEGGATLADTTAFLGAHGFRPVRKELFARKPDRSGAYYDVLFARRGG